MTCNLSLGLTLAVTDPPSPTVIMTVTHPAFGLRPRLRLQVGGLGLAVIASQSRSQTDPGVWATSLQALPCHSHNLNMSLYQRVHRDIFGYIKISCWLPTYLIFFEIYQNTPTYATVYWNICIFLGIIFKFRYLYIWLDIWSNIVFDEISDYFQHI